jgi:hypothetical protein
VRWYPWIPLTPQAPVDGGVVRSAGPEDEAVGLQGVQNAHWPHAGIVSPSQTFTADESQDFIGDGVGLDEQREVVAPALYHRPAEFTRRGRLGFVRLAELKIAS